MIITLTGRPCTGKSTTAEIFVKKYNFKRVYAGAIFKSVAKEKGIDITELASGEEILKIDIEVDNNLKKLYETSKDEDILIESRTAWSFMPNAFNVFIDVSDEIMAERLYNSARSDLERGKDMQEAKEKVLKRYTSDVNRYKKLYNIDCDNRSNYDLIVDNSLLTPEETADFIYNEYKKFKNR